MPTVEQQALADVLKAPSQGGAALAGGSFGAGTDVPATLAADPVAKQLLEEQVATRVGGQAPRPVVAPVAATPQKPKNIAYPVAGYTARLAQTTPGFIEAVQGQFGKDYFKNTSEAQIRDFYNANYNPRNAAGRARAGERPVVGADGQVVTPGFEMTPTKTEEQIRQEELDKAQAMIDATNSVFQSELNRLKNEGQARLQQTSSIAVGAGLAGSNFQGAAEDRTQSQTNDIVSAREAARRAEVAAIMAEANNKSSARFREQQELALKEAAFISDEQQRGIQNQAFLQDRKSQRVAELRTRATNSVTALAQSGFSLSELSPEEMQGLKDSGLSDFEIQAIYSQNTPSAQGKFEVINGQMVNTYFDPVTGQPQISVTALPEELQGVAAKDVKTIATAEGILVYDANNAYNQDGSFNALRVGGNPTLENTFLNSQLRREEGQLGLQNDMQLAQFKAGLPGAGADLGDVSALRKEFNSRVGDFTDVSDAYSRVLASVGPGNEGTPAGDIALIFNYMKMLDPGSPVRS